MRINTRVNKEWLYLFAFLSFYIFTSLLYNNLIINDMISQYGAHNTLSNYGNFHDYFVYKKAFEDINRYGVSFQDFFNNINGIALFYYLLYKTKIFPSFEFMGYFVNLFVFILLFRDFNKICELYKIKFWLKLILIINPYYLYLMQLPGKDILYSYFIITIFKSYLFGERANIVLKFILCAIFVRFQIVCVFGFMMIFTNKNTSFSCRLIINYLLSSFLGILAFKFAIGEGAEIEPGITAAVKWLNNSYYIGNMLLNPIRLVQYVFELYYLPISTPTFQNLSVIPFSILLVFAIFYYSRNNVDSLISKYVISLILLLLIIPIINLRYLMNYLPILIIYFGVCCKKFNTKGI